MRGSYPGPSDPQRNYSILIGFMATTGAGATRRVVPLPAPGRGGQYARDILAGFEGTIQVAAYTHLSRPTRPGGSPLKLAYCVASRDAETDRGPLSRGWSKREWPSA